MTPAELGALLGGLPALIGAITALVWAIRGQKTANKATATARSAYTTAYQAMGQADIAKDGIQAHIEFHNPAQPPPPVTSAN